MPNKAWEKENLKQWETDPCGALYGKTCPEGSPEFFAAIADNRYRVYAPWLKPWVNFPAFKGKKVLEVGCGMGIDLKEFALQGAEVWGIDPTVKGIELAEKSFEQANLSARLQVGKAETLPFPDESFDLVYSCGVLHHIPEVEKAVAEIFRVLKKGGEIKIILYYRDSLYFWFSLWFYLGILKGEFFRGLKVPDLLSKYVEHSETGARPYVKVYSQKAAKKLFSAFLALKIKIYHLKPGDIAVIGNYLPKPWLKMLEPALGWYLCLSGIKK